MRAEMWHWDAQAIRQPPPDDGPSGLTNRYIHYYALVQA